MSAMERAPEAMPQSRDELRRAARCPEIIGAAKERRITGIVHFTRIRGFLGILASATVKNRRDLPEDELVRHVYEANADDRTLDERWHDYVNLSVTTINVRMFRFSQRQHPGDDWVILEFGPEILGDRGVVFCTTNNIYPAARRRQGLRGFEQLFAPTVPGWYGYPMARGDRPPHQTTDPQAEVLYPFELPLKHLHTVTVPDDHVYDAVEAALCHFPHEPKIKSDPEAFR